MELRPAVFVDRDGTIMAERAYLADPADVALVPGSRDALAALQGARFALVVVTNQSGIARGLYTENDYHAVAARLAEVLAEGGVVIDRTDFCKHHPDFTGPCACRKPGTGMHRRAATELGLDPARSYYIGDKATDILPAIELGGQGVLVRTGYGREHEATIPATTWVADDLRSAAELILSDQGR